MRFAKALARLVIILVVLSLLLSATVAFAAEKTATVTLKPVDSGTSCLDAVGQVSISVSSGPSGDTTASVVIYSTETGHMYALSLGRQNHTFRELALVAWVPGTGGAVEFVVPLDKVPTNGQAFQFTDYSTGNVVAVSDPIKY